LNFFVGLFDSFPCVVCKSELPDRNSGLCLNCFNSLPLILGERCPGCGAELDGIFDICSKCMKEDARIWDDAFALTRMEGSARLLIHQLKYKKDVSAGRTLALEILEHIDHHYFEDVDYIVPIPLHWTREIARGFNQSSIISDLLSKYAKIPSKNILKRIRVTLKQASLEKSLRKKNLIGAFSVKKGVNCRKCTILLVDDVMTTGSTLSAASDVLVAAGVEKIKVLVTARA